MSVCITATLKPVHLLVFRPFRCLSSVYQVAVRLPRAHNITTYLQNSEYIRNSLC